MLAVGSVVAGAGVLLVGLLALLFRHPRAPRWTRPQLVAMLLTIPITGMIGFGLGHVLYGTSTLLRGQGSVRELAVAIAVPVVVALVWYALGIARRLRAYAALTAGPSNVCLMTDIQPVGRAEEPPAAPANPPRRPTRKAA